MATAWYYALDGESRGPISTEELKTLITSGRLTHNDYIWRKGLVEWVAVSKVRDLAALVQAAQPATQPQTSAEVKSSDDFLRLAPDPDEVMKKQSQQEAAPQPVGLQVTEVPKPQTAQAPASQMSPAQKPQAAQWYYARDGKKGGPVSAQYLKEKAQSGQLLPTDLLWKDGLKDWVAAGTLPGLKFPATTRPLALQAAATTPVEVVEPFALVEPVATPDENSIFDIMNDPGFATAPASGEKPNAGLATMPSVKKKRKQKNTSDDDADLERMMKEPSGFLVILSLVLGVIFTGFAIWHYYSYVVRLRDEGITVEATVIDVQKTHHRRRLGYYYRPTVTFTTESGQHITVKASELDESRDEIVVGDKLEVVYLPEAPEKAEFKDNSTFTIFNGIWISIAIACFILAAGSGYKWFTWRQSQAAAS